MSSFLKATLSGKQNVNGSLNYHNNFYVNLCNSAKTQKMSPSSTTDSSPVLFSSSSSSSSSSKTKEQRQWSLRLLTISRRRKLAMYHFPALFLVDILIRFAAPFGIICSLTHVIIRALKNDIIVRKRVIWTQVRETGLIVLVSHNTELTRVPSKYFFPLRNKLHKHIA